MFYFLIWAAQGDPAEEKKKKNKKERKRKPSKVTKNRCNFSMSIIKGFSFFLFLWNYWGYSKEELKQRKPFYRDTECLHSQRIKQETDNSYNRLM